MTGSMRKTTAIVAVALSVTLTSALCAQEKPSVGWELNVADSS